ncbi:MAG: AAA family ATPase [Anaerolineae bacterium]|nr:AAA family ATPase [Anaerolineae bacterium]
MVAYPAAQTTCFVGRSTELDDLAGLMKNPLCRLLTVLGPGGIGKTRIVQEFAAKHHALFSDGVYIAYFQAVASPDSIVPTIAEALDLRFQPGEDLQVQLVSYLRGRSLLLVLDNFEHLLDGVSIVGDILASTCAVRLLITSRERLNLREEWVYEIHGLDYPINDTVSDIERFAAVQLFVHSARRIYPGFRLTQPHKSPIARICRIVGGIPLGIELASAWTRTLPCDEIAREIERSLDILESSARNVLPRHRNMRAAFEPTWNRLSEDERSVFTKLSVFRGGCTREAAEYVAGATLRTLSTLVDKSLLRLDANGQRYSIHELLRQYGEERLCSASNAQNETLDRHCAYYMRLLGEQENHIIFLGRQKEAIEKIDNDLENVRVAWRRAVTQGRLEEISQAAEGLWSFY